MNLVQNDNSLIKESKGVSRSFILKKKSKDSEYHQLMKKTTSLALLKTL